MKSKKEVRGQDPFLHPKNIEYAFPEPYYSLYFEILLVASLWVLNIDNLT